MDLLLAYRNEVTMVAFGRAEPDLLAALRHPLTVLGSDGFTLDPAGPTGTGVPHPRSYGCYPRYLAGYAGPDLATAVAKCTGWAADRMGLADRGRLLPGRPADLVVYDPARLRDRATFDRPHRYPEGIRLVVVNGRVVVDEGVGTGDRPGEVLR
jgi:N-acyl-D-amino-acid deacylase